VRAYDPGSSQWTTPDAYAGDITDPMSQQKYMWNGNNPIMYGDPSGYDAFPKDPSGLGKEWVRENPKGTISPRTGNPIRGRSSGEWFRNSKTGDWVRYDPANGKVRAHWSGKKADRQNANKTPGGQDPPGRDFRNERGNRQHQFFPGQESPDFHNEARGMNLCACGAESPLIWFLLGPSGASVPDLSPFPSPIFVPAAR
ncbi:MAG TPA: hypothetical protein VNF68_14345, partial [Candidatus Baltobacteraceae bacterium]|nr:hypothetical protein [Candidatus Baltobacteraceae bacterium]